MVNFERLDIPNCVLDKGVKLGSVGVSGKIRLSMIRRRGGKERD